MVNHGISQMEYQLQAQMIIAHVLSPIAGVRACSGAPRKIQAAGHGDVSHDDFRPDLGCAEGDSSMRTSHTNRCPSQLIGSAILCLPKREPLIDIYLATLCWH